MGQTIFVPFYQNPAELTSFPGSRSWVKIRFRQEASLDIPHHLRAWDICVCDKFFSLLASPRIDRRDGKERGGDQPCKGSLSKACLKGDEMLVVTLKPLMAQVCLSVCLWEQTVCLDWAGRSSFLVLPCRECHLQGPKNPTRDLQGCILEKLSPPPALWIDTL